MIFFSYLANFSYFSLTKIFRKLQDTFRAVKKNGFSYYRWFSVNLFSNQNHPWNEKVFFLFFLIYVILFFRFNGFWMFFIYWFFFVFKLYYTWKSWDLFIAIHILYTYTCMTILIFCMNSFTIKLTLTETILMDNFDLDQNWTESVLLS